MKKFSREWPGYEKSGLFEQPGIILSFISDGLMLFARKQAYHGAEK